MRHFLFLLVEALEEASEEEDVWSLLFVWELLDAASDVVLDGALVLSLSLLEVLSVLLFVAVLAFAVNVLWFQPSPRSMFGIVGSIAKTSIKTTQSVPARAPPRITACFL